MTQKPPIQKLRPDQHLKRGISAGQIALIGRVIVLWSNLEAALGDTIRFLLDLDDEDGRIVTMRLSADAKIQMLRSLGPHHISDKDLLAGVNKTLRLIDELKDGRNFIAHGVWGTLMPENVPIALSLKPRSDPGEIVSETFPPDRMKAIIAGIEVARQRFVDLPALLGASRRVPR